jgi:plastocyanin
MKRWTAVLAILIGAVTSAGAAGCGSSSNSASETTVVTVAGTTSTVVVKNGKTATAPSSPGLQHDTTPKYATPASSEPVQSGVIQVAYRDIAIDPDTVRAKTGSTIKWTNYDSEKCNVTSEGGPYKFASKDFGEGESFELKLSQAGVIHYECTLYPTTMNGTIEVVK